MRRFAISDTHLGHRRIEGLDNRPIGWEDRILQSVAAERGDILFHLGDVALYDVSTWHKRFLEAASGFKKKWLIRGNHDNKTLSWFMNIGWDACFDKLQMGKLLFTHAPVAVPPNILNIHGHLHADGHRQVDLPGAHMLVFTDLVNLKYATPPLDAEPGVYTGLCKHCGEMLTVLQ